MAVLVNFVGIVCLGTAAAVALYLAETHIFPVEAAKLAGLFLFGLVLLALAYALWTRKRPVPVSRSRKITWAALQAAILILWVGLGWPNVRSGFGGSRQKRTMSEMRTIAMAAEAYATDHNRYPVAASLEELVPQISPTYLREVPRRDSWRNEFHFETWQTASDSEGPQHYLVASGGRNRRFERNPRDSRAGATTHIDCDIVFSNGEFIQYPEGIQRQ